MLISISDPPRSLSGQSGCDDDGFSLRAGCLSIRHRQAVRQSEYLSALKVALPRRIVTGKAVLKLEEDPLHGRRMRGTLQGGPMVFSTDRMHVAMVTVGPWANRKLPGLYA